MWPTELGVFFQVCIQRCISLEVKCIPRAWSWTVSADCISKHFCFDDNDFWGPHTIDRFACSYNAQLPRFNYSILSARLRGSFFIKVGVTTTTTGFVLGFVSLLESSGPCSPPMEVSFFSGMPLLEMEFCGMDLLSTGYICLTSRGYLFQPGPQFPFQIQALFKSRLFESISPSSPVSFCSTPAAKFYLCAPSRFLCVYLQVWSR